jgi:hypothetical protein
MYKWTWLTFTVRPCFQEHREQLISHCDLSHHQGFRLCVMPPIAVPRLSDGFYRRLPPSYDGSMLRIHQVPCLLGTVPQYAHLLGRPLLLKPAVCGLSSCGRLWAEELFTWLTHDFGLQPDSVDSSLLILRRGGSVLLVLKYYSDDLIHLCNNYKLREHFECEIGRRFSKEPFGASSLVPASPHDTARGLFCRAGPVSLCRPRVQKTSCTDICNDTTRRFQRSFVVRTSPLCMPKLRHLVSTQVVIGCLIWLLNIVN